MLLSWLADLAVLALAFVALGERPPWAGLVLAYCLGQAASALPFTPGGLAVVEGGLTATLVAFGGCPAGTLTAVLLYRLISHWAVVPAGGLAWLALRRRTTDEFRARAAGLPFGRKEMSDAQREHECDHARSLRPPRRCSPCSPIRRATRRSTARAGSSSRSTTWR